MPVPPPPPCGPARSFQTVPDRPQPRFTLLLGQLALLLLVLGLGTGCRATRHVVRLSQPHAVPVAHQVQTLNAAFEGADGRLWLQISGRFAGTQNAIPMTVVLPPLGHASRPIVQRVVVPVSVVQAGQAAASADTSQWKPIPIGPPLVFKGANTYDWDRLLHAAGSNREVRLVHRPGTVGEWELLHLAADPANQMVTYTVFEVKPQQSQVRHRAALALLPLAMASDVVAVTAMVSGPILFAGMGAAGGALSGYPHLIATAVDVAATEPVKQFRGR